MTLAPGWYLVGRHGSTEGDFSYGFVVQRGFFKWLRVTGGISIHHEYSDSGFWFERQEIPDTVPESFQTDEERN